MMLEFTRDFEIPSTGITDQFKINSYASFTMELLNIVKDDKKRITIYDINEWEGEKNYRETINIKDENDNVTEATTTVKKNVLSYKAILTSNLQTVVNSKRKVVKQVRKLPNLDLEPQHSKPTIIDIPENPKPPKPPKEPEEPKPKPPKEPPEPTEPIKDNKVISNKEV